jgi:transposase, IS5 family
MSFEASFLWARMQNVTTRGMKFLDEMNKVLPRDKLTREIEQKIKKAKVWRPRYSVKTMIKIYFLQQRYNLSDPWVEDAIYDRVSFQKFLDMDILKDKAPDESTILLFRRFLEEQRLQERLFKVINQMLVTKWLLLKEWTTVDATIISAPSSTKNEENKRDPEMHSTKKWNNHYFGMKAHVGTDSQSWLIHSVICTSANIHDSKMMDQLLHWEEQVLYGDSAYMSEEKRKFYNKLWVAYHVCRRWTRYKKLDQWDKRINRIFSEVRAKWEWAFGVIKNQRKHRKVRYRWIYKNWMQRYILAAVSNIYMVRKRLLITS